MCSEVPILSVRQAPLTLGSPYPRLLGVSNGAFTYGVGGIPVIWMHNPMEGYENQEPEGGSIDGTGGLRRISHANSWSGRRCGPGVG